MDKQTLHDFFGDTANEAAIAAVLAWLDGEGRGLDGEDNGCVHAGEAGGERLESEIRDSRMDQLLAARRDYDAMMMHARGDDAHGAGRFRGRLPIRLAGRFPRWARSAMRYAAVAAAAVTLAGVWVSRHNEALLAAVNTISVPCGQRVDVTLPDGTRVCLNALSELSYPSSFAGGERRVKLTGEAYFDVSRDASKPFVVETFACDVRVTGTSFDVEAYPDEGEFSTSLIEGGVRVVDRREGSKGRTVELIPGQRLDLDGGRMMVGLIPEGEQFLWRDGLIAFRQEKFAALIDQFEKYFQVDIVVPENRLFPTNHFTGKIRISEGVDHALRVLARSVDFTWTRLENTDTIIIH